MAMVEEVWKNAEDGEYYGIHSGHHYEKNEVEKIGYCYWTKPQPFPGVVNVEVNHE